MHQIGYVDDITAVAVGRIIELVKSTLYIDGKGKQMDESLSHILRTGLDGGYGCSPY